MKDLQLTCLREDEKATLRLRALFARYGYRPYRMSKFEEYDLYVRNKSFLLSDHVITFTDTDGKLMALKPDVTLSIVKNSKASEGGLEKVFYNEKVGDYAAAGLPVVNTQECPEYRELVERYNCGINCPVGQWEPVAEALERLMDDEKLRLEMGKNARRLAEDWFDRDKSYEKIADFVKTVYEERWN